MYRAAASNHVAAGSDGIYLSSLDWPHTEREYLVMRELSDPDIYARKNKHYVKAQQESNPVCPRTRPAHSPRRRRDRNCSHQPSATMWTQPAPTTSSNG